MSSRGSSGLAEPTNVLQRPSSARTQDVSHLLSKKFGDIFARDIVDPLTVENLRISQGSDDPYHEHYVNALLKVVKERQNRLENCNRLEKSLLQAKAKAMAADEREMNRLRARAEGNVEVPSIPSHLRSCLDNDLLRDNGLICPQDLSTTTSPFVPMPVASRTSSSVYRQKSATSLKSKQSSATFNEPKNVSPTNEEMPDSQSHVDCESECEWPNHPSEGTPMLPASSGQVFMNPRSTSNFGRARSADAISQKETKNKLKSKRNKLWRQQMNEERRDDDRKMLTLLQGRVDFLKNPRHFLPNEMDGTGSLISGHKRLRPLPPLGKDDTIFIALPAEIKFTEYEIGSVYELKLELKNVTTSFRSVRILPPATKYFSVGLGQFPGESNIVAPGLSCQYTIRFSPDSRGDFEDEVIVETQNREQSITIKLIAQQPRPILTIPENWNIGEALVFGSKVVRHEVKNLGGKSKFVLLSKSSWPATNFKTSITSDTLVIPPFLIRPALFELDHNQSIYIEIVFMPIGLETYMQEFVLLCDNCHVKYFHIIGSGELASIDLINMEGGLSEPDIGELCDATAHCLVRFDELHPYTYSQKKFTVKNLCHVDLSYAWKVIKPVCLPPKYTIDELDVLEEQQPLHNRTLDLESPFTIEPQLGIFKAAAETEFVLTFAPTQVEKYHSVLHLVLQNIPDMITSDMMAGQLSVNSHNELVIVSTKDNDSSSSANTSSPEINLNDVTGLEIEVKGSSIQLDVQVNPQAIIVAGKIMMGITLRRQVQLMNLSQCPVAFSWDSVNNEAIIEVEPRMGLIQPGQEGFVDVCITGTVPGSIQEQILCHVENRDDPVPLTVEAVVKGPEISVEQPCVDFGLVRLGSTIQTAFVLYNKYQIPAEWSIRMNPDDKEVIEDCQLSSVTGVLSPLCEKIIEIYYTPKRTQKLKSVLEIHVANGTTTCVNLLASVQKPIVSLLHCQLNPDNLYLNITSTYEIQLSNQTDLPTKFSWKESFGDDDVYAYIRMEPSTGIIEARETLPIKVFVKPKEIVKINSFYVNCDIEGMDEPVVFSLVGFVQGPRITYKTSKCDESSQSVDIDFGSAVTLGHVESRHLYICNNTAIPCNFNLLVDHFVAIEPTEEDPLEAAKKIGKPSSESGEKSLLCRTANLADPRSKPTNLAFYDYCKKILGKGLGAAFLCIPNSGHLDAFEEKIVEIKAYSDMWGNYQDLLICQISNFPETRIPLTFGVVGCPLEFTMTAGRPDQKPNVRFGTRTNGSKPVSRPIRINNKSPFDLRIDWDLYLDDSESEKLLDICLCYGKPFPPKDSDGNEIIKTKNVSQTTMEDSTMAYLSASVLPDSADSSDIATDRDAASCSLATNSLIDDTQTNITSRTLIDSNREEEPSKVISLIVRPHDGVPAKLPFQISPNQLTIPAESYEFVSAIFTPEIPEGMELDEVRGLTLTGYGLGFLSLDQESANLRNKVSRQQAYDVEQLRLDFTGKIDAPNLEVDYNEDDFDGYLFECVLSDLLPEISADTPKSPDNLQLLPQSIKKCSAVLRNCKETPTTLDLVTKHPFTILKPRPSDESGEVLEGLTLNPRETCLVELGCIIEPCFLDIGHDQDLLLPIEDNEDLMIEQSEKRTTVLKKESGERIICFKDSLILSFSNGTHQLLPCRAKIAVPGFKLSKPNLEFGTCFVGQRRELQCQLLNPTKSHLVWRIRLEESSANCCEDTFIITPTEGYLKENLAKGSADRQLLRIYFNPKHSEFYEARFVVEGILGEDFEELYVSGEGSYDEKYQELYNI